MMEQLYVQLSYNERHQPRNPINHRRCMRALEECEVVGKPLHGKIVKGTQMLLTGTLYFVNRA